MRRIGNRIIAPLFALLLAASLAFGVTSSFAQVGRMPDPPSCANNNDDLLGDCGGYPEVCNYRCQQHGYVAGDCIGDLTGNCCVCQR